MGSLLPRWMGRLAALLSPETVRYEGLVIPGKRLRQCGPEFGDDAFYVASAEREARRLIDRFGLTNSTPVLDLGCGTGRLAIGLLRLLGEMDHYRGVDVDRRAIQWCQKRIAQRHPGYRFLHLDVYNPRYHTSGEPIEPSFRLPFDDGEFHVVHAYSVFSHLPEVDTRTYLGELHRVVDPSGGVFLTAFLEEGVPDVTVNPEGYRKTWSGPLHCVRYRMGFFEELALESGFHVSRLEYGTETDGQSALYLGSANGGQAGDST